jgi:hypothetical protein
MDDDWIVELLLDHETRVFELHAKGSAEMIKHFLTYGEHCVVNKLSDEAEFDKMIPELTTDG